MKLSSLLSTDRAREVILFLREHPQGATLNTLVAETHCTKYEINALMVYWGQRNAVEKIIINNYSIYRLK